MRLNLKPETYDLLKLMEHPWKFFDHIVRYGFKGFMKVASTMGIVIGVNAAFIITTMVFMLAQESWGGWLTLVIMLILAILSAAYAAYRSYQFVMIQVFQMVYDELRLQLKEKLYPKMVQQIQAKSQLRASRLIDETFDRLPWLIRKPLQIIMRLLPIVNILPLVRDELKKGGPLEAERVLDEEINTFLVDNIFQASVFKWLYWLVPLNIVLNGLLLWNAF